MPNPIFIKSGNQFINISEVYSIQKVQAMMYDITFKNGDVIRVSDREDKIKDVIDFVG